MKKNEGKQLFLGIIKGIALVIVIWLGICWFLNILGNAGVIDVKVW